MLHYKRCCQDQIVVNLDGNREFFRAIIFDKYRQENKVINEPGLCSLYLQIYLLTCILRYILYDADD
jgi:hypothetical protein